MKKKLKSKRIVSLLLTVAMLLGMVPSVPMASAAMLLGSSSSLLGLDSQPPAGMATAENPYGYAADVAFNLSVGDELLYLGGEDGDKHTHVFNGSSTGELQKFVNAPNNGSGSYKLPDGTWNWVQAVAFDASADSARDNHVFFVGIKESDKCAYAWVLNYDNGNNTITDPVQLGNMSWIGNDYAQYMSTSLIEVAAGDFDCDGVDTLLAYVPLDLNSSDETGCSLFELTYSNGSLTAKNSGNHLLMDQYINDQSSSTYKDQDDAGADARDKLAVSMQVGDFNGDNVDDLAVLSYSHNRARGGSTAYYTPILKISYGEAPTTDADGNVVTPSTKTSISAMHADNTFAATGTYTDTDDNNKTKTGTPMGACLAVGDFNGDSYDDLYVTGVLANLSGGSVSINENYWYMQAWYGNINDSMTGGGNTRVESNAWFRGGFYASDNCYGKVMSAGVAVNGGAAPEMLFICGNLYNVSTGAPKKVANDSYFDSEDDGANGDGDGAGHVITNTFIQSVAVGNFDNNDAGREQVVFVVGLKQTGQDDYYFMSGTIYGTNFQDGTYSDGSTYYGTAAGYYCTDMNGESAYIHSDKGDNIKEGLLCSLISLDYDADGLEAKYIGASYVYTNPTVTAVLQAAPYFGDVSDGAGNSTGYTIETDYSIGDINGDSTHFNIGAAFAGGIPFVYSVSAALGFQHEWSKKVTTAYETTYSETFYAGAYDSVIVNRIPMIVYKFDLKDANGKWTGKTAMEMSVPQQPVYENMSVNSYNTFADAYNNMMSSAKDANGNPLDYDQLVRINEAENWLEDNEGNPFAYNQDGWTNESIGATQISKSAYSMGTNGGAVEVAWTEGNSTATEETNGYGFYFDFGITFGPKDVAGGGIDLGLNYQHILGDVTVTGSVIGTSCQVVDLDGPALLAAGLDEETLDLYNFSWTFGKWERDLGMKNGAGDPVMTTFLGYSLDSISAPPKAVTDLKAESVDQDTIKLSWTAPETPTNWPEIDSYVVYQVVVNADGTKQYTPLNYSIIGGQSSSVEISDINGTALQPNTEYTFCIRTCHGTDTGLVYSALSEAVTACTTEASYPVYMDYDEQTTAVRITTEDGTVVNDGDSVPIGTVLTVEAEVIAEDYVLDKIAIVPFTLGGKTEYILSEDGGKSITTEHTTKGDIMFAVYTLQVFPEMDVVFADSVMDGDTLAGTVTANTDGTELTPPGGIVSAPVTFTAQPAAGYQLTGWSVTWDDQTFVYPADSASMSYELALIAESVEVKAVFKAVTQKYILTVTQPDEGGKILVLDAEGAELTPKADGTYQIVHGTPVTFVAQPATGYIVSKWTGDAAGQTSDLFTMNIAADTEVGIVFRAPVKYKVTYTGSDDNGNTVTVSPNIASGSSVAAGTELTFTAQAADGYRIESWTVTQGETGTTYAAQKQDLTSGSRALEINGTTTIDVSFVELEQHTIVINQIGEGMVTITNDGKTIDSGDSVAHLSNVEVTAAPADGWQMSNIGGWVAGVDGSYTITVKNVTEDQTFEVIFTEKPADGGDEGGTGGDEGSTGGDEGSTGGDEGSTGGDEGSTGEDDPPVVCVCSFYDDLSEGVWYHDACVYVINNGIMQGTSKTTFEPLTNLSRAMMVRILYNLEGQPDVDGDGQFTDVDYARWYGNAITWAAQNGIVKGINAETFAPNQDITREQMVAILYRYAKYQGKDVSAVADLSIYADESAISAYAKKAMSWAVAEGLIEGVTQTTLEPRGSANRAQVATIMMRYIEKQNVEKGMPAE